MLAAAKEEIIPPLAALPLSRNSHPGFDDSEQQLHRVIDLANSLNASGLSASLYDDGRRSRSTGKERDSESGLDYFGARYYGSALGRFTSADQPLLDQDPADPQSWNLYSYVRNNPLGNVDPTGQDCVTTSNQTDKSVTVSVASGTCGSGGGAYVNGTVDVSSLTYNGTSVGYSYSSYDSNTTFGTGTVNLGRAIDDSLPPGVAGMLNRAGNMAAPGVNLATNGLMAFGWIVAPEVMALSECGASGKDCNAGDTALAAIHLPPGARKILGTLAPLAEKTVADAIRARGGGGAQVNFVATWLQQMTVGDVAKLAAKGNPEASTAIKIVKDASRLSQK
jgi:RHS repeat-associated protein